jgi:hypothetical protein
MTSATYRIFRQAILEEKQVTCVYASHHRELCPHIIGHTKGEEKVLAFQFGGSSSSKLPPKGEWRCLLLTNVSEVRLREGPWRAGGSHRRQQSCVEHIDLDINVHVRPRRGRPERSQESVKVGLKIGARKCSRPKSGSSSSKAARQASRRETVRVTSGGKPARKTR